MLRPLAKERCTARQWTVNETPAEVEPLPGLAEDTVPTPRRAKDAAKAEVAEPPPPPKRRGRPPKMAAAGRPGPASMPAGDLEPSELRKKMVPPTAATAEIAVPSLGLGLGRRHRGEADPRPADERRPFRQVEVKKHSPGRGPNRHHRRPPGTAV